ncbi:MAG: OmpH family outer membrane protein [Bacteroidales bacterium]|jgi:Skp family chaperone for outer membrane proteins|nr:OmpH family outer membrane protein [Bacteroidales bacterium]
MTKSKTQYNTPVFLRSVLDAARRVFTVLLFSFLLLSFLPCSAQSKFGHVDYGEIMKNMHGIDSIQTVIMKYHSDLEDVAEQMIKELKEKETAFEKLAAGSNTSQAVLKIKQDELLSLYRRFQEFQQSAEKDFTDKKLELLEPFQQKLLDAIKKVGKAYNYNYIFDITAVLFFSPNDDITEKVKAELKIK